MGTDEFGVIRSAFRKLTHKQELLTESHLKNIESRVADSIFKKPADNEYRKFFFDGFFNQNLGSWFFYQEIADKSGNVQKVTLHYEVQPNGILRIGSHENIQNEFINGLELDNFIEATKAYHDSVMATVYKRSDFSADKKIA